MARKQNKRLNKLSSEANKIRQLTEQVKSLKLKKPKKATPFSDSGGILGKSIGSMFGNGEVGKNIGKWLGGGIGSIFGSGDYTMVGSQPAYNVLANGKQIPQFSTTHATNIVCHREYLGDIPGTAAFDNSAYPLNPGMANTFPWLSTIAENYQEYRFHGLIFEFRPLITDFVTSGAPGVVVMATNYNASAVPYASKQAMENSEFAVSIKPTNGLIHGVECDTNETILAQRYVRTGAIPTNQDLRLYDYGTFQFATQNNPVQNLGELWVSYCVEFFKPILPATIGGSILSGHVVRANCAGPSPFGLNTLIANGSLAIAVTSTTVTWPSAPTATWLVSLSYIGTIALIGLPSASIANGTFLKYWADAVSSDASTQTFAPSAGVNSTRYSMSFVVDSNTTNYENIVLTFGVAGVLPTGSNLDIFITQIDESIVG